MLTAPIPPRAGVDTFAAGDTVGRRTFEIDAAVGLLKRSAALLLRVAFLTGVGTGGAAFRALARDAAVGANKPDEGVFERGGTPDGVFERELGVEADEGVLGRLGVDLADDLGDLKLEGVVVAADLVDVPVCCCLRGWDLGGPIVEVVLGLGVTGDFCGVWAADGFGAGILTGVEDAFRTGADLEFAVDGFGSFIGSATGSDTTIPAAGGSTEGRTTASMIGGDLADEATIEDTIGVIFGFSSVNVDFGGHSLFCKISSLAESPVV